MEINVQEVNNRLLDQYIFEIANDNQDSLSNLYNMTSKKVYGFILSTIKNKHDAEDILHDTYISIYHSSKTYQSTGKPYACWLLILCRKELRI